MVCLQVLSAAVSEDGAILSPHLDMIMNTLYPLVQHLPNYEEPATVKSYNEVLRAFESICKAFSDRLISFLFQKLEDTNPDLRAGCLNVFRHLVNAGGEVRFPPRTYLHDKSLGPQYSVNETSACVFASAPLP